MNIVFFGSSSFSVPLLESISSRVSAVVTKKAKPQGRGYTYEDNEVKKTAVKSGIPVLEIGSFKDEHAPDIKSYAPDLFVVASFGLIIPRWVLDIPSIGAINVHPSLLPLYRGPSPIQWALLNGDKSTGITLINMNEKMDAGNIIYQETADVFGDDNFITLSKRLSMKSAEMLLKVLDEIEKDGRIIGVEQSHEMATFTRIITKDMGKIEWDRSSKDVVQQIKAFVLWPIAFTFLDGILLKIYDAEVFVSGSRDLPGTVLQKTREGFVVKTADGAIIVREVQLQNKKRMKAYEFANGYRRLIGKMLE